MSLYSHPVATLCLWWFYFITVITITGSVQILRHYSRPPRKPISSYLDPDHVPHVTIIRPCKGLEPFLYECLAAIFHQDYPPNRMTVHLCVASRSDAAHPVLQQLLSKYSASHDVRVFVEDEDPFLQGQDAETLGPNPKIRNMSRSYREAKGDIVWILDCNIWVGYGALGRMVDKLCGFTKPSTTGPQAQNQKPYKLIAHLPICVDVEDLVKSSPRHRSMSATDDPSSVPFLTSTTQTPSSLSRIFPSGSRLEQSFLSTAHAKMYVAINSISVAPCINGKSTMFRRSHLDFLTARCHSRSHPSGTGIDHFSHNICEDHLIGDMLWKSHVDPTTGFAGPTGHQVTRTNPRSLRFRNHGLAVGDLAVQPVAGMGVAAYIARRVRWLRVRKFTVMIATAVEPGTESLVCIAMGIYGVAVADQLGWISVLMFLLGAAAYWCVIDWTVSTCILGMGSVETETDPQSPSRMSVAVPPFARPTKIDFSRWFPAWVAREALALSIWTWAIWGGTTVTWREKKLWVGMDMRVHEVDGQEGQERSHAGLERRSLMDGQAASSAALNGTAHNAPARSGSTHRVPGREHED